MPGIPILITKAGRAALINAEHNGTAPLTIAEIGLTAAVFKANEDVIALPDEIKRLKSISGEVVAADTIHVAIRDDSADVYTVRGIGYWLSNGVLFGVYSQPEPIMQKSAQAMMLLQVDVLLTTINTTALTFGDANFTNPPATIERQGVVELATPDETVAGQDAIRAVTPAGLVPALVKTVADHTATADPHPHYLTPERGDALYFRQLPAYTSSDTNCDTLLETGVRDVSVANDRGVIAATRLPMGADGYGTLTTENGGQFVHQVYAEGTIAHRTWQRTGYLGAEQPFQGHDWKLVWDAVSFDPAAKQDKFTYTPVQQGTGIGQLPNAVKIGWTGNALKATVDVTDQGNFVFQAALDSALANKVTGTGMHLNWSGQGGQPTWLFGGEAADNVNVYNPANFKVAYANSAGTADSASKVAGVPMRFQENPQATQPFYLYGVEAGKTEITLYNRTALVVGYALQLSGQGLMHGGVGGYTLNKRKDGAGLAGGWEQRGQVYDYGSGASEGNESSAVLWQRTS